MQATFASALFRGDPQATRFLPGDFRDPGVSARVARRAAQRPLPRSELVAAIRAAAQDLGLPPSPAREANLANLYKPGTAAVVTGQQVGLFLGPLFTFYKAASAIATAKAIERESGVPCVPIFWLQTEDHDYEEINHCHVLSLGAGPGVSPLRLQLPCGTPSRVSVAHLCLDDAVIEQLQALESALGMLPHAAEFLDLLRACYRPGQTLGAAFASALSQVFAKEGMVIVNPRHVAIARLAAPIYRKALLRHNAIAAALLSRTQDLHDAGFAEQVHVRPDTSLVFFASEQAGARYRLVRKEPGWQVPDCSFSDEELLGLLERNPLCFSTSALLRPIVQDALLPTAAYIGGPGEISYLAQLGPLYELFEVPQPLIVPRARFRCLEDNTRSLLRKLGLAPCDAETSQTELLRRLTAKTLDHAPAPELLRARLLDDISGRLGEVDALDPALHDAVKRTRESVEHNIDRLIGRYTRLLVERDHATAERVERLQAFLYPAGTPQERYYSPAYFFCKHGIRAFTDKVLEALWSSPFETDVRDLDL